jgi:hypothetical protein
MSPPPLAGNPLLIQELHGYQPMAKIGNVCEQVRDKRFRKELGDLRIVPPERPVARREVSRL